jgi:hypothetical protein
MANTYIQTHARLAEPALPPPPANGKKAPDAANTDSARLAIHTALVTDSLEEHHRQAKLDSLMLVKNQLEADMAAANNLLGLGAWLPDWLPVVILKDSVAGKDTIYTVYSPSYAQEFKRSTAEKTIAMDKGKKTAKVHISRSEKFSYLWSLLCDHLIGFLITAVAISLGAPFWFDLLNKLMKLRTSVKEETDSTEGPKNSVSPDKRVG